MNALDILGAVGAASLRNRLATLSDADGTARFMLDRLTGAQAAAVVKALLLDAPTAAKVFVAVPRSLVIGMGLPDAVITDERTVALRHADNQRPALLLANTDDDQGASLQDVTLIGAKQLSDEPQLWVQAASSGLGLPESQLAVWEATLRGLAATEDWTLHQISNYVELTRRCVAEDSKPLLEALGWALPALQLPRDSGYFLTLRPKDQESAARWKKLFNKLISERKPLLDQLDRKSTRLNSSHT